MGNLGKRLKKKRDSSLYLESDKFIQGPNIKEIKTGIKNFLKKPGRPRLRWLKDA
jgi:hypothetical protein